MTAETALLPCRFPPEERPSQSMKEYGRNGRFFSLTPRLLRCAGPNHAFLPRDSDSAPSDRQRTTAVGAAHTQAMGEPISRGNREH